MTLLLMVGASASGKTEIAKLLIKDYGFKKMVTTTTRIKRHDEIDGVDYHFLDEETFLEKQKAKSFLEVTLYNNNYYGTALKDIGKDKVLIVDPQGANVFYQKLKDEVTIFFIKTSKELRKERMILRGDAVSQIDERLALDDHYFNEAHLLHIDYIIHNDDHDLNTLTEKIASLYKKHR